MYNKYNHGKNEILLTKLITRSQMLKKEIHYFSLTRTSSAQSLFYSLLNATVHHFISLFCFQSSTSSFPFIFHFTLNKRSSFHLSFTTTTLLNKVVYYFLLIDYPTEVCTQSVKQPSSSVVSSTTFIKGYLAVHSK